MLKTINYNTWDDENYNPKTLNLLPLHYMQVNLLSNHVFITFFYLFLDFFGKMIVCIFLVIWIFIIRTSSKRSKIIINGNNIPRWSMVFEMLYGWWWEGPTFVTWKGWWWGITTWNKCRTKLDGGVINILHFVVVKFCPQPGICLFYLYA